MRKGGGWGVEGRSGSGGREQQTNLIRLAEDLLLDVSFEVRHGIVDAAGGSGDGMSEYSKQRSRERISS